MTYNVWFDQRNQAARCHALLALLQQCDADFVCLQEVTPFFLRRLTACAWARERYWVSDAKGAIRASVGAVWRNNKVFARSFPPAGMGPSLLAGVS